jgi:mannose-6-phosphate isomerase
MSLYRHKLVLLPPNRVWRSYLGGRTLDALAGVVAPSDTHFPEDWIASVTRATNPPGVGGNSGISTVIAGGLPYDLSKLIAADPEYFLGARHVSRHGAHPLLLVKLLDPSIRLHFQVHPTADFARRFLQSASGKTEAYYVLSIRPEVDTPHIFLGFQRPPARAELRRLIETQDIAGIERCFDRIDVAPGETYIVPGGVPHALGAGVVVVEIQEPTDLVARFEFERGGYTLPESARFMNRGLDFCLDLFDLTPRSLERVRTELQCQPRRLRALSPFSWQEELIGPAHTPCFRVIKTVLNDTVHVSEEAFHLAIVVSGEAWVEAGEETHRFQTGDKFLVPSGLGSRRLIPRGRAEILECHPPL